VHGLATALAVGLAVGLASRLRIWAADERRITSEPRRCTERSTCNDRTSHGAESTHSTRLPTIRIPGGIPWRARVRGTEAAPTSQHGLVQRDRRIETAPVRGLVAARPDGRRGSERRARRQRVARPGAQRRLSPISSTVTSRRRCSCHGAIAGPAGRTLTLVGIPDRVRRSSPSSASRASCPSATAAGRHPTEPPLS
jgi:hypothetical protein